MRIRRVAVASAAVGLVLLGGAPAYAVDAGQVGGLGDSFDVAADVPEITIPQLETTASTPVVCQFHISASYRVQHASGSQFVNQGLSSRSWMTGDDLCLHRPVSNATLIDDDAVLPSGAPSRNAAAARVATGSIGTSTAQNVQYFDSNGAPTRQVSTVTFTWKGAYSGRAVQCFKISYRVVAGTALSLTSLGGAQPCTA